MKTVKAVLVTGGAGFIGSHVVDELVALGIKVRVLDSLHPGAHPARPDYLNPGAEYVFADLQDTSLVESCLPGAEAVCHLAAVVGVASGFSDAPDYAAANDLGTATLLSAMWRLGFSGRLVLASSMVVYGEGRYRCLKDGPVRPEPRARERLGAGAFEPACPSCGAPLIPEAIPEDAALDPRNVYAATKVHQEHLCAAFARDAGLPLVALRYHNVYGPRMPRDTPYAGVASIFRSALEAGRPPQVFEDGGQIRDFIHVSDAAHATVLALVSPEPPEGPFNIASGEPHTVGEMAGALAAAFGPDAPAPQVTGGYRIGDARHVFASPVRAEAGLGFRARVAFAEGMAEFARAPLRSSSAPVA